MSLLDQRFYEDRKIRDAARAVLIADIAHAKSSFSAKGVTDRVVGRIGDGALDVFETAKAQADDNRGIIAALIGAVLLWFGREPILVLLGLKELEEEEMDTVPSPMTDNGLADEIGLPSDQTTDIPPGDEHEQ